MLKVIGGWSGFSLDTAGVLKVIGGRRGTLAGRAKALRRGPKLTWLRDRLGRPQLPKPRPPKRDRTTQRNLNYLNYPVASET